MVCEVSESCLFIAGPVGTSHLREETVIIAVTIPTVCTCHLSEAAALFMAMDRVDIASLGTAGISPVTRVLYSLDYSGSHLVMDHDYVWELVNTPG